MSYSDSVKTLHFFFFSPMKFLYIGNRAEHQPEVKRLSVITAQEQRDHHEHLSQFSCLSCTLNWLRFIFKVLPCFTFTFFHFICLSTQKNHFFFLQFLNYICCFLKFTLKLPARSLCRGQILSIVNRWTYLIVLY